MGEEVLVGVLVAVPLMDMLLVAVLFVAALVARHLSPLLVGVSDSGPFVVLCRPLPIVSNGDFRIRDTGSFVGGG